ncbi:hypothetical protein FC36_GL001857 [Ligilactobacillus equi DSM 15833 = JCM 10991]|uniref:Phage head-tail adaptor n=2 Tax=Ligilactobacillus equi TaxID=137357 RepID=A0A0R1TGT5_9LACO|nr:hypothetical protein FC36_GL001857 [Ligilactobacillus equi DSM 15833 = JCM 10991]
MTERITFVAKTTGINEDFEPFEKTEELFSCWAEVSKLTVREMLNKKEQVGYRKNTPLFLIAYKQKMEIQPDWQIVWRGKTYEITGLDPDYQKKDLTKIQAREVS